MKKEFIILKTGRNEFKKVEITNIIFIKADGNYTKVITDEEEILSLIPKCTTSD